MDTIYILLVIGVLIYSLFNVITYMSRRARDRASSRKAGEQLTYHRKLTEDERRLLDRLQQEKGRKKLYSRTGDDVYRIQGKFNRHGITVRHNTEWHNLIGGLEVTLDDRGLDHIREYSVAEVIKTGKYPVVLTLNENFSLLHHIAAEEQLEKGETGQLAGQEVKLIANRRQTKREVQALEKTGAGLRGAFLLALALILIGLTSVFDIHALWGALPGSVILLISLWLIWRKPKWSDLQPVRRLNGVPAFFANEDSRKIRGLTVYMGTLMLIFDTNWLPFMVTYAESPVDVEVTKDGKVLRFGPHLSLEEEEKKFPTESWSRHIVITITAAVAIVVTLFSTSGLLFHILQSPVWSQGEMGTKYFINILNQLAPFLFIILSLILLVIHAPLALKGYHRNKERDQKIRAYYSPLIIPNE